MTPEQLLTTLQLNDTLFPTGGFAYSDGLETAVTNGLVTNGESLQRWMEHYVDAVLVPCEGLAIRQSMEAHSLNDWVTLHDLDEQLTAMKPSASVRASSRTLGKRFLKSVAAIHFHADLERAERELMNLPVAYGVVFSTLKHDVRDAILSFAYTRLASMTSAALRLMPVGQQQAQSILHRTLGRVPVAVGRICSAGDARLTAFTPLLDLQQMNHRNVYSRLFRS